MLGIECSSGAGTGRSLMRTSCRAHRTPVAPSDLERERESKRDCSALRYYIIRTRVAPLRSPFDGIVKRTAGGSIGRVAVMEQSGYGQTKTTVRRMRLAVTRNTPR